MGKLLSVLTYLGSIISETGGTDEDITARTRKAQSAFSMLMPVWNEKVYQFPNEAQDVQYKREVGPSVCFGNETTGQEIANLYQQVFEEDP